MPAPPPPSELDAAHRRLAADPILGAAFGLNPAAAEVRVLNPKLSGAGHADGDASGVGGLATPPRALEWRLAGPAQLLGQLTFYALVCCCDAAQPCAQRRQCTDLRCQLPQHAWLPPAGSERASRNHRPSVYDVFLAVMFPCARRPRSRPGARSASPAAAWRCGSRCGPLLQRSWRPSRPTSPPSCRCAPAPCNLHPCELAV